MKSYALLKKKTRLVQFIKYYSYHLLSSQYFSRPGLLYYNFAVSIFGFPLVTLVFPSRSLISFGVTTRNNKIVLDRMLDIYIRLTK